MANRRWIYRETVTRTVLVVDPPDAREGVPSTATSTRRSPGSRWRWIGSALLLLALALPRVAAAAPASRPRRPVLPVSSAQPPRALPPASAKRTGEIPTLDQRVA